MGAGRGAVGGGARAARAKLLLHKCCLGKKRKRKEKEEKKEKEKEEKMLKFSRN
jgi:hypothetical protein